MKKNWKNWGIYGLVVFSFNCLHAQCIIDSLSYELTECDGGKFYAFLNFQHDSTVSAGFFVAGNGINYGDFAYDDLPIKVGPLKGDGQTTFEFVITDKEHNQCSAVLEIGMISCETNPCSISEFTIEPIECAGAEFYSAKINLKASGFEAFDLFANEQYLGFFKLDELPLILDSIPACGDEFDRFVVCANDNEQCCEDFKIESLACEHPCGFGDLKLYATECSDSAFFVKLDLTHHEEGSDSFLIETNGTILKYFLYEELPLKLGPYSQFIDQTYVFTLKDFDDPDCIVSASMDKGRCQCFLDEFVLQVAEECNSDTTVVAEIDFFTEQFDTFHIYIDGGYFSTYSTSMLPLRIENFPNYGDKYAKVLIEAADGSCEISKKIALPNCTQTECFSQLKIELLECEGSSFYALLDFDFGAEESEYFEVKGNGITYGKFKYSELPIKVGPFKGVGTEDYEILIYDRQFDACVLEAKIENIDCGCLLDEMKLDVGACTSDTTYEVYLDFESSSDTFSVFANEQQYLGDFLSSDLPLKIEHFPGSGQDFDFITVCVGDDADCCVHEKLHAPGCAHESCFEDLEKEITACDSSGMFYVWLDFDHVGAHSETFIVKGNGYEMEFRYRDLPVKIGPFTAGENFYKFEVCDAEIHECHIDLPIGRVICDEACSFGEISTEVVECMDDGSFLLKIKSFETPFTGLDIYFNDKPLGFYKSDAFPFEVLIPPSDEGMNQLKVCVSDNNTCCIEVPVELPDCDQFCLISDLQADTLDCVNDSFFVELNFDFFETSERFFVKGNGQEYGSFQYADLPVRIGPLSADGEKKYEFGIVDSLFSSCSIALELGEVLCPSTNESMTENRLLIVQANDGLVYLNVPNFITEKTRLKIFNLQGHQMTSKLISSESNPIIMDIPSLYHGMYILHLESKGGDVHNDKFIIH